MTKDLFNSQICVECGFCAAEIDAMIEEMSDG